MHKRGIRLRKIRLCEGGLIINPNSVAHKIWKLINPAVTHSVWSASVQSWLYLLILVDPTDASLVQTIDRVYTHPTPESVQPSSRPWETSQRRLPITHAGRHSNKSNQRSTMDRNRLGRQDRGRGGGDCKCLYNTGRQDHTTHKDTSNIRGNGLIWDRGRKKHTTHELTLTKKTLSLSPHSDMGRNRNDRFKSKSQNLNR